MAGRGGHNVAKQCSGVDNNNMADIDETSRSSLEGEEEEVAALWPYSPGYNLLNAKKPKSRQKWQRRLICLNVAMLCFSLVMLMAAAALRYRPVVTERNALLKQTSAYSPLLDELDIPMINVHAPTFFDNSSIYRQLPSDEVDAAWKRLTPMRRVYLTTEQVIKLGKDPSLTVRDNENPDLHIGILNGMHELHCLDLVRKNLHRDYYWPDGIRNPIHWMHLYHCMDVILHALTCAGNMDVVTFNWMETQRDPFFDFGVEHVCRDFDRILDWQTSSLPMAPEPAAYRVGGEKEIPEHPLLQALHTQNPEDRVFTHNDPAFGGIGL